MSRSGEITLQWGDEERTFRLAIGDWRKVQEKCDAGPAEILARLAPVFAARQAGLSFDQIVAAGYLGRWRVDDVREPLYRGLIGGGMEPTLAGKLIRELVDERPLLEPLVVAYEVVLASIVGAEDEPLGEAGGEAATAAVSPEASSLSPTTTEPAGPSASAPATSTPAPSGNSSPPLKAGARPTARTKARPRQRRKSTTP